MNAESAPFGREVVLDLPTRISHYRTAGNFISVAARVSPFFGLKEIRARERFVGNSYLSRGGMTAGSQPRISSSECHPRTRRTASDPRSLES